MLKAFRWPSGRVTIVINFLFIGLVLGTFFTNCAKPAAEDSSSVSNDVGAAFSGQLVSEVQYVTNLGEVWGYAYDPQNKSSTVKVIFYVDGPVGVGQYAGQTQANIQMVGPNAGHFFSFKLPPQFADAKTPRIVTAYAVEARSEYTLYPGRVSYTSYVPKAESFYNQRISGFIQTNCTSCHSWSYTQLFSGPLMNPTPSRGGTAISNVLIAKMSGASSHSGRSFCSGVNEGICAELQAWWRAEFN